MRTPRIRISFFLLRLPVLLVYLVFFAVQLFYNIDASQHTNALNNESPAVIAKVQAVKHSALQHATTKTQGHGKLRLNKRFQPAAIPVVEAMYAEMPLAFPVQLPTRLPLAVALPSVYLTAHTLRGPPVV